jgi:hypothetical protein
MPEKQNSITSDDTAMDTPAPAGAELTAASFYPTAHYPPLLGGPFYQNSTTAGSAKPCAMRFSEPARGGI